MTTPKRRNGCLTPEGGFSLVELMMVVAIMALLIGYFSDYWSGSAVQTKNLQTYSDLLELNNSIQQMLQSPDQCRQAFRLNSTSSTNVIVNPSTVATTPVTVGALAVNNGTLVTPTPSPAATSGVTVWGMSFNKVISNPIPMPSPSGAQLTYLNFNIQGARRGSPTAVITPWSNDYTVPLQTNATNQIIGCGSNALAVSTPASWTCQGYSHVAPATINCSQAPINQPLGKIISANCGKYPIALTGVNSVACTISAVPAPTLSVVCCQ